MDHIRSSFNAVALGLEYGKSGDGVTISQVTTGAQALTLLRQKNKVKKKLEEFKVYNIYYHSILYNYIYIYIYIFFF